MNRSNNPALSKKSLDRISAIESSSSATITGTSVKVFLLLLLSLSSGYFGWQAMLSNPTIAMSALMIASLFGFIIAILTVFKPNLSYMTGPLYALCQGYVLGAISQIYNTQFDGIVLQAITLTLALFIVSLVAFTSGLIKVTKVSNWCYNCYFWNCTLLSIGIYIWNIRNSDSSDIRQWNFRDNI